MAPLDVQCTAEANRPRSEQNHAFESAGGTVAESLPQLLEEVLDEDEAALFQPISDRVLSERSNLNVPKSYRACAVLKRNRS